MNPLKSAALSLVSRARGGPIDYPHRADWMDSAETVDPVVQDPSRRLSVRAATDPSLSRDRPVCISIHGFGASSFEWRELESFLDARGVLHAPVVLGGHGRSLEEWRRATWSDWAQPILDEVRALQAVGFRHLGFAAASTGGALLLEHLAIGALALEGPSTMTLVAPLVVPRNRLLYQARTFARLVPNLPTDATDHERRIFYTNRPSEVLIELLEVCERISTRLHNGIVLPSSLQVVILQSRRDPVVDPVSAEQVVRGLKGQPGQVQLEYLDSDLHIPTRGFGRDVFPPADQALQRRLLDEIAVRTAALADPPS